MFTILEKYLISRLEFIRQIQDFLLDQFYKEEKEISDLLKQLTDYNFSAQTVRKIVKILKKVVLTLFIRSADDLNLSILEVVQFTALVLNGINDFR